MPEHAEGQERTERMLHRIRELETAIREHLLHEYETVPEEAHLVWNQDAPVVRLARVLLPKAGTDA